MIAIVNYGLGNVHAIANIYRSKNVPVVIAQTAEELRSADRIILPGVGAFDHAMDRLNASGMRDAIERRVLGEHMPVLGICVGMQMMANRSDEGVRKGLGWIAGEVKKFDISKISHRTHLPHMGWNTVQPRTANGLFSELGVDARFYFLHSYYFSPLEPESVLAVTDYNGNYASSVGKGSVFGVQFHPEKSHNWGVKLLLNFAAL
jgi:glutamine amidotransferase